MDLMTREQFSLIVKGIRSIWKDAIPDQYAFNMWYSLLKDIEYQALSDALKEYMMTNRFAPMPADLRELALKKYESSSERVPELEAWSYVNKAVRNSTYNAEDEFEKLPVLVQKAVGSPSILRSWATNDGYNIDVMQSNFLRSYRNVLSEDDKLRRINPNYIKEQIENKSSTIPGIGTKTEDIPDFAKNAIEKLYGKEK